MSRADPPRWADAWLSRLLPPDLTEEVTGDLHEAFRWRFQEKGRGFANRMFIWEVFRSAKLYRLHTQNNSTIMLFNNYIRIGLRFLWKTRNYASFNILGLAIGIAVAWLAAVYVIEEFTYDSFHSKIDRTYRIVSDYEHVGLHKIGGGSYRMGEVYPEKIPAIEASSRYKNWYILLEMGDGPVPFVAHRADKGIFDIFDFDFVAGTPQNFDDPNAVVISKSLQERLSTSNEMPDFLSMFTYAGDERRFKIIGVFENLPSNSTVRPDMLVSMEQYARDNPKRLSTWFDINMNVLLTLRPGSDPVSVGEQMTRILYEHDDFENATVEMKLQPFGQIHSSDEYQTGNGLRAIADKQLIYLVSIIGFFCLIISSINFANFSVSNQLVRVREVAIRKIFGSGKKMIYHQFLTETLMATILAIFLSLIIIFFITPVFANYTGKPFDIFTFFRPQYFIVSLLILLLVTGIAGTYPALILSRYKIINGLKGRLKLGGKELFSRSLVTLQFALAIFLVSGMLVFNGQLQKLISFDPGYNDQGVLQINIPNPSDEKLIERTKLQMKKIAGISRVTGYAGNNRTFYKDGEIEFNTFHNRIDEDYISLLDLEIVSGRDFNPDISADLNDAVIVNQTFVKMAGLEDPVGSRIPFKYAELENPVVIGIVRDYHFLDLSNKMQPMVLYLSPQHVQQYFLVRAESNNFNFLDPLDRLFRTNYYPHPFNYNSLQRLKIEQYETESQVKQLTQIGAFIAVFLACMGLIGIVGTHVRQRLKEVSIRKVNGASPVTIMLMFITRYIYFTFFGVVIGMGGAYWILSSWLEQYVVRIQLGPGIFAISIFLVISLAIITILSQLYHAMFLNPVRYLRDE